MSEINDGENVALGKSTRQSSTGYSGESSRAVDGDNNGQYKAESITHTNNEVQPWWEVDLASIYAIDSVHIWNSADSCCSDRLSDFYILVSDPPFPSDDLSTNLEHPDVVSIHYPGTLEESSAIDINTEGRYVRVQLNEQNALSIAEFEVFANAESEGIFSIPVKIEAEEFIEYHDNDTDNRGGGYRTDESVDIQISSDNDAGYNVGWMENGEWLEYPISVSAEGPYTAQLRLASPKIYGAFIHYDWWKYRCNSCSRKHRWMAAVGDT